MVKKKYDKSPLNYMGNKYKLLPQLMEHFPDNIDCFHDIFCGGLDVSANIKDYVNKVYCNDINHYIIDMYKEFQMYDIDTLLEHIDYLIVKFGLSLKNKTGFLRLRDYYNTKDKSAVVLFVLMAYSFNYQFRFNDNHDYNSSFGANRSSFNPRMRENLIKFHNNIKDIEFSSLDFRDYDFSKLTSKDLVYSDSPYLISVGSYNDGRRGFKGWNEKLELELYSLMDELDSKGIRFALSNVTEHKGRYNSILMDWSKKYEVRNINMDYNNSSYHLLNRKGKTKEVLVTNY